MSRSGRRRRRRWSRRKEHGERGVVERAVRVLGACCVLRGRLSKFCPHYTTRHDYLLRAVP